MKNFELSNYTFQGTLFQGHCARAPRPVVLKNTWKYGGTKARSKGMEGNGLGGLPVIQALVNNNIVI